MPQSVPWARLVNIFAPWSPLVPGQIDDLFILNLDRPQIVPDAVLDQLIYHSGGLIKDFIVLVRKAAVKAQIAGNDQVTLETAEDATHELRRERSRPLTEKEWTVLDEVARTNQRVAGELCDRLLYSSVVLNYINADDWYDVHAVLWDVERGTTG